MNKFIIISTIFSLSFGKVLTPQDIGVKTKADLKKIDTQKKESNDKSCKKKCCKKMQKVNPGKKYLNEQTSYKPEEVAQTKHNDKTFVHDPYPFEVDKAFSSKNIPYKKPCLSTDKQASRLLDACNKERC